MVLLICFRSSPASVVSRLEIFRHRFNAAARHINFDESRHHRRRSASFPNNNNGMDDRESKCANPVMRFARIKHWQQSKFIWIADSISNKSNVSATCYYSFCVGSFFIWIGFVSVFFFFFSSASLLHFGSLYFWFSENILYIFVVRRRIGRQGKELGIKTVADVYEYFGI